MNLSLIASAMMGLEIIKDTVFVPIKKPIFQIVACRPWDP